LDQSCKLPKSREYGYQDMRENEEALKFLMKRQATQIISLQRHKAFADLIRTCDAS